MHDCRLLRGVVRSSRPANIPTLFTNAAVAWAAVRGAELPPAGLYAGVVLMGLCFYLYGMWENDRVDARWDASRYPDRPVPCGAVSVSVLRLLSLVAGLSGLVLNMALGGEFAAGDTIAVSTEREDSYARKISADGTETDLIDKVDIAADAEPFFAVPLTEPCILRISAAAMSGTISAKAYFYYRTV